MKVRRSLLKDTVVVQTRTGDGAYGPIVADPVTVVCQVDETRRMVRDSNGDEVVSEATLVLHPRTRVLDTEGDVLDTIDPTKVFLPESPVTIGGRASRVLSVKETKVRSSVLAVQVTCA